MIAPPAGAPLQVSIDNQLGDAQDRYFGLGFLRVEHTVASHTLSKHRGLFEVAASYPLDWSKKNQKPQTAHLSSVDALVLTARVVELWLQHQGLARRVAGAWFSKCELRPGRTPVDVSQPLIASLDVSLADGTHGNLVMDARCRIAEFSVSITLQIPPQADGIESKVICSTLARRSVLDDIVTSGVPGTDRCHSRNAILGFGIGARQRCLVCRRDARSRSDRAGPSVQPRRRAPRRDGNHVVAPRHVFSQPPAVRSDPERKRRGGLGPHPAARTLGSTLAHH